MSGDRQIQKAGDGSQQIQAGTVIINEGITEERARAIFAEMNRIARQEYTQDAYRIAEERVEQFEEKLMPRMVQVEGSLSFFADPAFQFLLRQTQLSAAATEREVDYEMLAELLVYHVQKGRSRHNRAGIKRAVEIVGEIDNDALCALTVAHALTRFVPLTGDCLKGLQIMNEIFRSITYTDLPQGSEWLEHLDTLGVIRITYFGTLTAFDKMYSEAFNGYVCVGIDTQSDDYKRALEILETANLSSDILVPNVCLDGYSRLAIRKYDSKTGDCGMPALTLSGEQKEAIESILRMYVKDINLENQVKHKFAEMIDSFESLKFVRMWWDAIPQAFNITQVGHVLANTNARRCNSALPELG